MGIGDWKLESLKQFSGRKGPVFVVVMDGVGVGRHDEGDAVWLARTPTLDWLKDNSLHTQLKAHGTAVGLPSDADMGNSEVGHNAIGAGRVFDQGASLVSKALASGAPFHGAVWHEMLQRCTAGGTLHLIGLVSDGNVHSHIHHLYALIEQAAKDGVRSLCVHGLLDGRDVDPTSALEYFEPLDQKLHELSSGDRRYRIASGGGRMVVTMDRYEADWRIVERGWKAHVLGEGRAFRSAKEAIQTYRSETPGLQDQLMGEFVVVDEQGKPVGPIVDGDTVIFFNFRGDRALEISRAFEETSFDKFDRRRRPAVLYAGMMQYDGDLKVPQKFLVDPPALDRTVSEYLARNRVPQFACAETQKFGHVTYFWNGNRSGKFAEDVETYAEVRSDQIPFDQRPWMKAGEVTDATLQALLSDSYRFLRVNFANGDMVGHTGNREAAIIAVEAVDLSLGRLLRAVTATGGIALITADHGNADEMYEWDAKTKQFKRDAAGQIVAKVSHTLNPVPFLVYDPQFRGEYRLRTDILVPGLANIAATALNLLGFMAPEGYEPSLLEFSGSTR